MGQITRLLSPPERLVLNGFRRLAPFRRSYDLADLALAGRDLRRGTGIQSDALLSQMLFVDREFARFWPQQSWNQPGYAAATSSERVLLNLLYCAQSSQFRLEWLITKLAQGRDVTTLQGHLRRLAAILLMSKIVLPDPMRGVTQLAPRRPPGRA